MNKRVDAAWLLDVNALIALLSANHVHHERMQHWFARNSSRGWATCPITENGVIRIASLESYGQNRPNEIIAALKVTLKHHAQDHHFWPNSISLTDESVFRAENITGHKLVTDSYLLGLAAKHGAKLVSFDRTLPWQAIQNGTAKLIETP